MFFWFCLRVVSGSRDATLRVWDIETGQCLHVLMGHVAAVRCVQYDGRRVVSGAYDFMVKVWDPETETCLHTLQGHTNRVYSLQVSSFRHTFSSRAEICCVCCFFAFGHQMHFPQLKIKFKAGPVPSALEILQDWVALAIHKSS